MWSKADGVTLAHAGAELSVKAIHEQISFQSLMPYGRSTVSMAATRAADLADCSKPLSCISRTAHSIAGKRTTAVDGLTDTL